MKSLLTNFITSKVKEIARELRSGIVEANGELARKAEPMTLRPADFEAGG
jgi:hypothetical protein